jgi:hypothetical protein
MRSRIPTISPLTQRPYFDSSLGARPYINVNVEIHRFGLAGEFPDGLFQVRNAIAHEGIVDLPPKTSKRLIWAAESALRTALEWFASNPGSVIGDLDEAIGGNVPA